MMRALPLLLLVAAGCTEQVRPCSGTNEVWDGTMCIQSPHVDAALPEEAGTDAGEDAGPCGGACGVDELCDGDGGCVHCLGNDHCTFDRPTCESGECVVSCTPDTCSTYTSTPRCGPGGACVPCLPGTEVDDCDGNSCDPTTNTCTMTLRRSVERCLPCNSSNECEQYDAGGMLLNMVCAETTWANGDAGRYCVVESPGATVRCPKGTPRHVTGVLTREGSTTDVCLPINETTCAAIADDSDCTLDEECGLPLEADGICFMDRCETPCSPSVRDDSCPGAQTCTTSPSGDVCNG
ncbi:MAG: hypothetical protein KC619_29330 [Myxococcales bacterium]|nr:hypothetical protein [Myxococcales bacterium]